MMNNFYWIFKVCHEDGREWTKEEIDEYIDENYPNSVLLNGFDCFLIDQDGYILYCDKCGNYEYFTDEDVRIVWNKEVLEA